MNTTQEDMRDNAGTLRIYRESTLPLTITESTQVDARQDDLMEIASPDGRSPSHAFRSLGWRWFAIVAVLAVLGGVTWMLLTNVRITTIIGLGALGAVFAVLGGWPVLMASFQRGREERGARRDAKSQLHVEERTG
ncbi:MAG TPA: hypothetical protein VHN77_14865 [Phycisphaerales bacterium]|nr:hypothetical protein [Phycisphaerales bacterium]